MRSHFASSPISVEIEANSIPASKRLPDRFASTLVRVETRLKSRRRRQSGRFVEVKHPIRPIGRGCRTGRTLVTGFRPEQRGSGSAP